jgi:hypothetical protein
MLPTLAGIPEGFMHALLKTPGLEMALPGSISARSWRVPYDRKALDDLYQER